MGMARTGQLAVAAAAVALLAGAPPAGAQTELYNDFQGDGIIDGCSYSPGQLQDGLNGLSPDVEQYAPGFGDQLRSGLTAQCGGGGGAVTTTTDENGVVTPLGGSSEPPTTTEIRTPTAPEGSGRPPLGNLPSPTVLAAPTGSQAPDGLLAGLVAALLLLIVVVGGAYRVGASLGADRFTRPLRASFAEAGGRTADTMAYARDLARYGR